MTRNLWLATHIAEMWNKLTNESVCPLIFSVRVAAIYMCVCMCVGACVCLGLCMCMRMCHGESVKVER